MKKRVLPLLMASSMMVSVTSPLFAQENEEQFDIHSTTEFVEETQSLEKNLHMKQQQMVNHIQL